jgi:hypothetical protein
MKKLGYLLIAITLWSCSTMKNINNKSEKWITLFNGKDIKDWNVKIHHHDYNVNFGNTFRVVDGIIQVRYDQYGDFNDQFGHLYYKTPFSYYHLKLKYRFVGELQKGAPSYTLRNSGLMFHSQDPKTMPKEQDWPISIEMQFLGGLSDGRPAQQAICAHRVQKFFTKAVFFQIIVWTLDRKHMMAINGFLLS